MATAVMVLNPKQPKPPIQTTPPPANPTDTYSRTHNPSKPLSHYCSSNPSSYSPTAPYQHPNVPLK